MRHATDTLRLAAALLLLLGGLADPAAAQRRAAKPKPKPEPAAAHQHHHPAAPQPADRDHKHHDEMGHDPSHMAAAPSEFQVKRVFRGPENFTGNLAYDPEGGRLWLLSFGPPANTKGPSTLYEVDPATGKVLAQTRMPFLGEFGAPVFMEGHLWVGVSVDSKLYKVAVGKSDFGKIVSSVALPTLNDLEFTTDEPFRFPFINFPNITATPDKQILLNAEDIGLLVKIDKETGKVLGQVTTMKGLGAAINVPGPNQEFVLLGNSDPEMALLKRDMRVFMFRAAHGFTPPYAIRTEVPCSKQGARDISWVLIDPQTGELLASTMERCSRASAGSVALLKQEKLPGTRYGRYTFFATGEEGILTVDWVPR